MTFFSSLDLPAFEEDVKTKSTLKGNLLLLCAVFVKDVGYHRSPQLHIPRSTWWCLPFYYPTTNTTPVLSLVYISLFGSWLAFSPSSLQYVLWRAYPVAKVCLYLQVRNTSCCKRLYVLIRQNHIMLQMVVSAHKSGTHYAVRGWLYSQVNNTTYCKGLSLHINQEHIML